MRWIRRTSIALAGFVALIAIGTVVNACVARRALEEEIASADRDPETGVIRGCEAITLEAESPRDLRLPQRH